MTERRTPKNKNNRMLFTLKIAASNVQRTFMCSMICTVTASIVLILINTLVLNHQPALTKFVLPGAFYAVGTAAFAVLLFTVMRKQAKEYYDRVSFLALIFNFYYLCYLSVISMKELHSLAFYCVGVLLVGYTMYVTNVIAVIIAFMELAGLLAVVMISANMGVELEFSQIVIVIASHAFSFIMSRDIFDMKTRLTRQEFRAEREMKQAEIDPLTGLINRRGLEREIEPILELCQRQGDSVGVMIIDIDHFKAYNDGFGHMQGDECLKLVAKSIDNSVGEYGFASRIGGEEFLVFMYGMTFGEMISLAEKVRRDVEALRLQHATGPGAVVTISVGCDVETASSDVSFNGLYGKADKLLYKAKTTGRNRVISNKKVVPVK